MCTVAAGMLADLFFTRSDAQRRTLYMAFNSPKIVGINSATVG
jgi:hypothetical protein